MIEIDLKNFVECIDKLEIKYLFNLKLIIDGMESIYYGIDEIFYKSGSLLLYKYNFITGKMMLFSIVRLYADAEYSIDTSKLQKEITLTISKRNINNEVLYNNNKKCIK